MNKINILITFNKKWNKITQCLFKSNKIVLYEVIILKMIGVSITL